jgi:hypothetical protein
VGRLYPSGERLLFERGASSLSRGGANLLWAGTTAKRKIAISKRHYSQSTIERILADRFVRQPTEFRPNTARCCGHVGHDEEFSCPTMHTARRMQAPRFIEARRSIMGRAAYLARQGKWGSFR